MRYRLIAAGTLCILPLAAQASAQTPPERPRVVVRERTAPVLYQRHAEQHRETERATHTLRIGSTGELDVVNIAGDVVVTRGRGNEATVEVVKTAHGRSPEDAREMLSLVTVEVNERAGRGEIRTRYPDMSERHRPDGRRNLNVSVAYTIAAPEGTRLTIRSISGSINVTDIKGDLSLESTSGGVSIANGGRITGAKSISGTVSIVDTRVDGAIDAGSVSGNVITRNVQARRINVGSISGNVVLESVTSERTDAQSFSGNVQYSGSLSKNGRYELKSHSGDVRLTVAGGTGFEVDANSFSGSVRADVPMTMRSSDTGDRPGRRRTLRAVHGDGSAVVNITTFSGNVVISKS